MKKAISILLAVVMLCVIPVFSYAIDIAGLSNELGAGNEDNVQTFYLWTYGLADEGETKHWQYYVNGAHDSTLVFNHDEKTVTWTFDGETEVMDFTVLSESETIRGECDGVVTYIKNCWYSGYGEKPEFWGYPRIEKDGVVLTYSQYLEEIRINPGNPVNVNSFFDVEGYWWGTAFSEDSSGLYAPALLNLNEKDWLFYVFKDDSTGTFYGNVFGEDIIDAKCENGSVIIYTESNDYYVVKLSDTKDANGETCLIMQNSSGNMTYYITPNFGL